MFFVCETITKTAMPEIPTPLGAGQGASLVLASPAGRSNVGGSSGSAMKEQHRITAEKKSSCLTAPKHHKIQTEGAKHVLFTATLTNS